MKQVLELSDKDFKEGLIKILQQSPLSSLEAIEKWENLNNKRNVIKKNQMGITEVKNTIAEIKKLLDEIAE